MNNSCPICSGQTKQVPSHRFGAGYYECIEAGRRGCDRFFREDELVDPLVWSLSEAWGREMAEAANMGTWTPYSEPRHYAGFPAGRQNSES